MCLLCFIISYLGNFFSSTSPRGAYIRRGDLTEGFFALRVGGGGVFLESLIHGGLTFGLLR